MLRSNWRSQHGTLYLRQQILTLQTRNTLLRIKQFGNTHKTVTGQKVDLLLGQKMTGT